MCLEALIDFTIRACLIWTILYRPSEMRSSAVRVRRSSELALNIVRDDTITEL